MESHESIGHLERVGTGHLDVEDDNVRVRSIDLFGQAGGRALRPSISTA
jgi:hypothetical protein